MANLEKTGWTKTIPVSYTHLITHPGNYAGVPGERMCFAVFRELPVWGDEMLSVSLVLFAFATIIGWNVYGLSLIHI